MSFLLPVGLLALLTLPVIVLLHLIRQRRKRVVVPSLLNWRNMPQPKAGRRFARLPLTLLLLLQLLVAALIALAVARPQIAGRPLQRAVQTVVVLDASTSMAARAGASTRFEQARGRVRALLNGLNAGDSVTLVAANPNAQVIGSGGSGDQAALTAALDELQPGGAVGDLEDALALAEAALEPGLPGRILVLTDGSATPPSGRTTVAPVEWQQIGDEASNRAIIAFAARPAGGKTEVYARIANYGDGSFDGMLRLFVDEQPVDARPVRIEGNAEAEQTWTLGAGGTGLRLALDGGDALPEDDAAYVSLATTRPLRIALVADEPDALRRGLTAVPGVTVTNIPLASYPSPEVNDFDITVFDGFLPDAWPDGASLVIDPSSQNPLLPVQGNVEVAGEPLAQRGALLAGLGFAGVNFGSVREIETPAWATTLLSAGDTPLVLRGREGAHELAVWTFSLRESNLATRLAFPLLVARTVRDLAPASLPTAVQAGGTLALRPDPRATALELVAPDGLVTQVTPSSSMTVDTLTQPGWYELVERGERGELFRGRIAVNAGTPLESDLRQDAAPVFESPTIAQSGQVARQMTDLWPWLALAGLGLLVMEWLYVHRRTASA